MTVALIDDRLLGQVLRGSTPRALRRAALATTGHWYVRLCQAALTASDRPGALSRPFDLLDDDLRAAALNALLELPPEIGLPSLRHLGPMIGRSKATHHLNMLSAEALAAAVHLDATVFLTSVSPRLEAALEAEGIPWRRLAT